mgnify:CR=1 FL=1
MRARWAVRAFELRPTLACAAMSRPERRGDSRTAATVQVEMAEVRDQAGDEVGIAIAEALALTALGEAALKRDADPAQAQDARRRGARDPRPGGRPRGTVRRPCRYGRTSAPTRG